MHVLVDRPYGTYPQPLVVGDDKAEKLDVNYRT